MSLTPFSVENLMGGLAASSDLDDYGERVLSAAAAEFDAHGLRRTSLERIAAAAGVSHMTVYRRFGNRDTLLGAVVAREGRRLLAELDAAIADVADPEERFVAGVVAAARMVGGDSLLRRLLVTDPGEVLPAVTIEFEGFLGLARQYVAEQIRGARAQGVAGSGDPEMQAELLVRVAHSMLLSPAGTHTDEDGLREFARNNLLALLRGTD